MIRILFGVYGDEINAQNINGIEIARRLDKKEFEVHMLYYNNKPKIEGIIFHKTTSNKIAKNINKLILYIHNNFDMYYLPRVEKTDVLFAKYFGNKKCIVSSVEIENAIHVSAQKKYFCDYIFNFFTINKGLQESIFNEWKIKSNILYLGYCKNKIVPEIKKQLNTIAFVGSLIERKRPNYILKIAKKFPEIQFKIIGDGPLKQELNAEIKQKKLNNVILLGKIDNTRIYEELNKTDLLIITSDNEGQPKVSLEAASLAVPTCYIKNTYKIDYIRNFETGFEAKNLEDIYEIIRKIQGKQKILENTSANVLKAVEELDWDILIADYEKYFTKIIKSWNNKH